MMNQHNRATSLERRRFLKVIAATAAAATATGAGAGLLKNHFDGLERTPVVREAIAPALPPASQAAVMHAGGEAELLAQLTAAQAENVRLRSELDAARRRIEAQTLHDDDQAATVDTMQARLSDATYEIGILQGLIALYEQLDDVDLDGVLADGLDAVGAAVGGLVEQTPSLSEGLALGHQALRDLEAQIPALESGRRWIDEQVEKLEFRYAVLQATLENVLEAVGPILTLIFDWLEGIKKWLPFGVGENAVRVVGAVAELLAEAPPTTDGLRAMVADPLDAWLGDRQVVGVEEAPLRQQIVRPLRERALQPAEQALARVETVRQQYAERLAEPVGAARGHREGIKAQIKAYRESHQLS